MSYIQTGSLSYEELKSLRKVPSVERYAKGPVAIIECVQEIPCNPCEAACPAHAVCVGTPIVNLPCLAEEKCTGCGMCAAKCPGMAIFIVDKTFTDSTATVTFPYEYYPAPETGNAVHAVNRAGTVICDATVVRVMEPAAFDHTPLVMIEIPKKFADDVRSIERGAF